MGTAYSYWNSMSVVSMDWNLLTPDLKKTFATHRRRARSATGEADSRYRIAARIIDGFPWLFASAVQGDVLRGAPEAGDARAGVHPGPRAARASNGASPCLRPSVRGCRRRACRTGRSEP